MLDATKYLLVVLLFPVCLFSQDAARIAGNKVNVREKPDIQSGVIAQLNRHDRVRIVSRVETKDRSHAVWFKVTTPGGKTGYVYSEFVHADIGHATKYRADDYSITAANGLIRITRKRDNTDLFKDRYNGNYSEIVRSVHSHYLFVSLMDRDSVFSIYTIVYDLPGGSVAARVESLPSPSVLSVSYPYMLLDSGTSAGTRQLHVIDLPHGGMIHEANYATCIIPDWEHGDTLVYYQYIGPKAPGMPALRVKYDGTPNSYIQKILWSKGKIIPTGVYKEAYEE